MKDLRAARQLLLLCVSVIGGFAVVSCQSPQPKLRTVGYDDPYRPTSTPIASGGRAQFHQLIEFCTETNPQIGINRLNRIVRTYIDEAAAEGINSDIAFCQMVHETNYLRFGGDVEAWQNNFCGLGATGGGNPGLSFSSVELGIRAHIQHLKAYANAQPLRKKLVDPAVRSGSSRAGALCRGSHGCVGDGPSIRGEAQAKAPDAGETSVDSRLMKYHFTAGDRRQGAEEPLKRCRKLVLPPLLDGMEKIL